VGAHRHPVPGLGGGRGHHRDARQGERRLDAGRERRGQGRRSRLPRARARQLHRGGRRRLAAVHAPAPEGGLVLRRLELPQRRPLRSAR
jgi:hypothetical protein